MLCIYYQGCQGLYIDMRENFFFYICSCVRKNLLFYSYAGEIYYYEGDKPQQNLIIPNFL